MDIKTISTKGKTLGTSMLLMFAFMGMSILHNPEISNSQSIDRIVGGAVVGTPSIYVPPIPPSSLTPSVATTVSALSIVIGSTVSDNVVVSGTGGIPSGDVIFSIYLNGTCSGSPVLTENKTLSSGTIDSSLYVVSSSGDFSYNAQYGGDTTYSGLTSDCEPFSVTIASIPNKPFWQQGIDPGADGSVDISLVQRDGLGLAFFSQNPTTEVNTTIDQVNFPITVGGYTFPQVHDLTSCPRRESTFDFTAFAVGNTTAGAITGLLIDTLKAGVVSRKLITTLGANESIQILDGHWAEGFSTGEIVVSYFKDYYDGSLVYHNALTTMRSTNYGSTWTEVSIVDSTSISFGIPLLFKGQDDNLYITSTNDLDEMFIYKSLDKGATWTYKLVGTAVDNYGITQGGAASATKIYVSGANGSGLVIYNSSNGGDNWTSYTQASYIWFGEIAVDGNNLIIASRLSNLNSAKILKSTDDGQNVSIVLDLIGLGFHPSYELLRNEGSIFTYTYCGMHDGSNVLIYYISADDGDTWTLKHMGYKYIVP